MIKYPDYENCIAGIPNSILKNMGIEPGRRTSELLDRYLAEKDYENIVVILLDGMGKNIIDANLSGRGFFKSHMAVTLSSTFPPTTVAATTSILSGMEPCEHGWLGWDCYYPQIDKNVTVFLNKETGTDEPAEAYNVPWRYCGYEGAADRLVKNGRQGYMATPFVEPFPDSFEKIVDALMEKDPQHAEEYRQRADEYIDKLAEVDAAFRQVSEESARRTIFFGGRFAMTYFVREYDFDCVSAYHDCSAESEPSISSVMRMIDEIKESGAKAVYYEELADPKVARTIADETGVKLLLLHSAHNVSRQEYENGVTYLDIMWNNVEKLKEGLN